MAPDLADLHQRRTPAGRDIGGVEMGGVADAGEDRTGQGAGGDRTRAGPGRGVDPAAHHAGAGEGELASAAARGALEHHAANGLGEGRMANAVQNHLGHGLHAVRPFAARFVIDGLRQAIQIAAGVQRVVHAEGSGGVGRRQAGATKTGTVRGAKLFKTSGQQFGLAVTLGGPGAGIGIVPTCNGQGAGVQAACCGGQGFFGEAGCGGALNPFGLGAQRRRARSRTAKIGASDRQTHQTPDCCGGRHGLHPGHTIGAQKGARLRGMRQRGSPVQQGEKRGPRGSLAGQATLSVAFQPAESGARLTGPGVEDGPIASLLWPQCGRFAIGLLRDRSA